MSQVEEQQWKANSCPYRPDLPSPRPDLPPQPAEPKARDLVSPQRACAACNTCSYSVHDLVIYTSAWEISDGMGYTCNRDRGPSSSRTAPAGLRSGAGRTLLRG